jgi:glutamate/tyrosine decarboxylase-like PLP-dependent enzyme
MPFPSAGEHWPVLKARMNAMRARDVDWRNGRSSLHVYYPGDQTMEVAREAYGMFMSESALATAAFPSLRKMEDDLVDATVDLFRGPATAAGCLTTGGTESIILVVKAARDRATQRDPERFRNGLVLLPETAHPAFEKAADLLRLEAVRIPVGPDYRAAPDALAAAIDHRTILMVASAPSLPFGLIDPVAKMAEVALDRGVWLHVDACVGGYLAPFVTKLGFDVPQFDFSIPGVRSISADLHKFGYAAKGASILLYRTAQDMAFQSFTFADWPKGQYYTPTLLGTRSGGPVAAAWAVMHHLGENGYLDLTRRVMRLRDRYIAGIEAIDGLKLIARPDLSIVSYTSDSDDIVAVGLQMAQRGWYVSYTAAPTGMQQTINLAHESAIEDYLTDLAASVRHVRTNSLVAKNFEIVTY